MKQLTNNIYHVGDNGCSVYMVDTQSDQGLVLIDAGMDLEMIRQIGSHGIPFENIRHCIHTPGHTPGSLSVWVESQGKKVLFGQDLHGPFDQSFLSDLQEYQKSMQKLLDLKADILCEGHFGIYQPGSQVREYIETHKRRNQP